MKRQIKMKDQFVKNIKMKMKIKKKIKIVFVFVFDQ